MNKCNSNNGNIWHRFKLPKELHRAMKLRAAQESKSLQDLTVEMLHSASAPKKIEAPSVPREVPVVDGGQLSMKRCVKCSEETARWVLAKDGKVLCQDCAQDLRVANA